MASFTTHIHPNAAPPKPKRRKASGNPNNRESHFRIAPWPTCALQATATDRTSEDSYTMWLRGSAGDSVSTPVASITAPLAPATAATATTFGIEAAVIDPVVTQEPLGISETELQHQQPSVAEPVRVYPQRCVTRGFVRVMLCARPNPHACGWLSR